MIELNKVKKVFNKKSETVTALNETSLKINKGEIFGIIGYSGAGKSTLLRCINLLEEPSSGNVVVDGENIIEYDKNRLRKYRQTIGMIFQQFNLIGAKTVAQNIAFNLKAAEISKEKIDKRIDELLELVGLSDKKYSYPKELSGGQKQRVGIARALATNPKVLLCDEATSALDPITTKQILNLLKEINTKLGITTVLVTHEMEVIKQICDRVAVMENGNVIELGTIFEVFSNPKTKLTREFIENFHHDALSNELLSEIEGKKVNIVFKGDSTNEALVHTVANKHNIVINIVSGRIEYIENKKLGTLTLSLIGDEDKCNSMIKELESYEDLEVSVYA